MAYMVKTAEAIKSADRSKFGVRLGLRCVALSVPISVVASKLNVSRNTVLDWFTGVREPGKHLRERVEAYYRTLPTPGAEPGKDSAQG